MHLHFSLTVLEKDYFVRVLVAEHIPLIHNLGVRVVVDNFCDRLYKLDISDHTFDNLQKSYINRCLNQTKTKKRLISQKTFITKLNQNKRNLKKSDKKKK